MFSSLRALRWSSSTVRKVRVCKMLREARRDQRPGLQPLRDRCRARRCRHGGSSGTVSRNAGRRRYRHRKIPASPPYIAAALQPGGHAEGTSVCARLQRLPILQMAKPPSQDVLVIAPSVVLQAFWNMPTAQQVIPMPSTATEDWQRRQLQQRQPQPAQAPAPRPAKTPPPAVASADIAVKMPKAFWNIGGAATVLPNPHARLSPPPLPPAAPPGNAPARPVAPVAAQDSANDDDTSFEALQRRLAALKAPSAPAGSNPESDGTCMG